MKKVIVTGVAGFIGSRVAEKFYREGYHVIGIDDLSGGKKINVPEGVEFIKADLADKKTMDLLPVRCDLILHLAGQSSGEISFDDPIADLQKNTISTLNLINYGIRNNSERIVFASSMSVYGAVEDLPINEQNICVPLSCYGVGKYAAESYLRIYQNKLPSVSLRMFNVYGPGQDMDNLRQGMVSVFLAQAIRNKEIIVKGSLERFRDFVFIDDAVNTWFKASTSNAALGETINLGTGARTTIGSLLAMICKLVPGSSYVVQGNTPGDQSGIFADNRKLKEILGIDQFTSLETGLQQFTDWAKLNC